MGIKERREREKEQRRNAIIDAAEDVFFAKGIDNATMDEVAEKAELSKGTLYLYFKSKEDLYLAINLRASRLLIKHFKEATSAVEPGLKKVHAIGLAYLQFAMDYPNYFNAMMYYEAAEMDRLQAESPYGEACAKSSDEVFELVQSVIRTGIEDGSIRDDFDPHYGAFALWAQTNGLFQVVASRGQHLRKFHQIDPEKLTHMVFELIKHSIQKH